MFDGQIICGTNGATYEITAADSRLICGVEGGMCIARGVVGGEEILVQGTYTMLCIYKKRDGRWVFSHALDGFMEPVRSLAIDYTGTIWAGHLHRGLYAVRLSKELDRIENITRYRSLDGVNEVAVGVHAVNNRVVFSDRSGFYTYDDIRKEIVPYNELDSSLGAFAKSYNTVRFGDDYWFITPDEAGLFAIEGTGSVLKEYFSYSLFGNQTVDDNQQIVPLSADACLVTLENGLAIYTVGKSPPAIPQSSLRLKEARATDREQSRRQTLPLSPAERPILGYDMGNVSFTVFYPRYDMMKNIVFRYKLDGLDVVQGEATDSPTKQYQHLPYGKYTFRAEVFTKSGLKLSELAYPFRVRPPFYLSVAAIVFYTLLILLAIWLLYRYVRAVTERKNSKIHAEQQKRIQELENERLEGDLRLKSKELAASTMELIKKNENLIKIKNELTAQKEALGNQYPTKYYRRLVSLIDESISSQEDWAAFLSNFDRIHENFFRNLHHRYPELTANDLRFCAYLRLNLSSKDIASLMNISLKGVEVARYRIRKKIGLPSDKSLTGFMLEMK
jgi:DNA-binding CsgD family transcriptional regulator